MLKPIMIAAALIAAAAGATAAEPAPPVPVPVPVSVLERLAAAGNAEAAYHVGMAYHTGSGVTRDTTRALAAFRQAAAGGDPLGAYKLGFYYAGQGDGVIAPDPVQALRHKLIAAEAGYALAQLEVAAHYGNAGQTGEALQWLERAAAQGEPQAMLALAGAYRHAPGITPDPVRSATYLRLFVRHLGDEGRKFPLAGQDAMLTPAQRVEMLARVHDFRIAPTPLTIKAQAGRQAADLLARTAR